MNYENKYNKMSDWFRKKELRIKIFNIVYKILPIIVVVAYASAIILSVISKNKEEIIRIILTPLITFLGCTLVRRFINEKRPYEASNITPLIKKEKAGQSFPSRHVVSASVIGMSAMYLNTIFGIIMLIVAMIISIIRVVAGVHYTKDVIAGYIFGIVGGIIGFYII